MGKRLLSALMALCMALTLLPIAALAVRPEPGADPVPQSESDWVTYPVGGGNIYFDPTTGAITDCDDTVTRANIPATIEGVAVTGIGDFAFAWCSSLTSVTVPDSVTSIGNGAFFVCSALTEINVAEGNQNYCSQDGVLFSGDMTELIQFPGGKGGSYSIPASVVSIGISALRYCSALTEINVAEGNKNYCSLEGVLFSADKTELIQCPGGKIGAYSVPEGVTSIGSSAFEGCSALTEINVAEGNQNYCSQDGVLFSGDMTTLIQCPGGKSGAYSIPKGVTKIRDWAFRYCSSLTSVIIPQGVTSIGWYAFSDCSSLTSVTILEGVTIIGASAFQYCSSLTSVTIPKSVTRIDTCAFSDCGALTDVYYGGSEQQWVQISIGALNTDLIFATIHYNSTVPATYTVTFTGGPDATGTPPTQKDTAEGGTFTLPENTFEREGYTFAGWNDGEKTYQPGDTYTMPGKDVTFTAQWTEDAEPPAPATYTVTFTGGPDATGTAPTQVDIAEGGTFTLPENTFEREGYTFAGWDDGEKTYQPGDTYTMPGKDVTFTAQWTENAEPPAPATYTVTFTGGPDATGTAPTQEDTAEGGTFTLPENTFEREGYTFAGWSDGEKTYQPGDTYTMPGKDVTFTAQWTKNAEPPAPATYTVTFTGGPDATGTAPTQKDTAEGGTFTLPENTFEREGYTFAGWSDGEKTYQPGDTYTMPGKDVTFTAQWTENADPDPVDPDPDDPDPDDPDPDDPDPDDPDPDDPDPDDPDPDDPDPVDPDPVDPDPIDPDPVDPDPDDPDPVDPDPTVPDPQPTQPDPQPEAPWVNPFSDVEKDAWYIGAVEFVSKNNLMNGVGDGSFAPNDNLTRAQLAQILYNKENRPAVSGAGDFADVAPDAWYADAMAWAVENGVMSGYGNGLFGPEDDITREQLAIMLWRYAGKPAAANGALNFTDADQASGYALDALLWAVENGIINGRGNGILDPGGLATRAEVAQMLKNYLDR